MHMNIIVAIPECSMYENMVFIIPLRMQKFAPLSIYITLQHEYCSLR